MTATLELLSPNRKWFVLEKSLSTGVYEEVGQALQCPHCQMIWQLQPGSGKVRGFCFRCNAATCGKQGCDARCEPWEAQLERMESRVSLASSLHRIGQL